MTEEEWSTSQDVLRLFAWERVQAQDRRVRLFGCACCRQLECWLMNPRARKALEASERRADNLIQDAALRKWDREVAGLRDEIKWGAGQTTFSPEWISLHAVAYACTGSIYGGWRMVAGQILNSEATFGAEFIDAMKQRLLVILRDIFGNPFRPVAFAPEWLSDTAVSLAKHIYESRDFSAMPILADALQDAGCDHDDVLNHCRDPQQVHVRGCWVVDGVLGKS